MLLLLTLGIFESLERRFCGGVGRGQAERVRVVLLSHRTAGIGFVVAGNCLDVELPLRILSDFGAHLPDSLFQILVDDFDLVVDAFGLTDRVGGGGGFLEVDAGP